MRAIRRRIGLIAVLACALGALLPISSPAEPPARAVIALALGSAVKAAAVSAASTGTPLPSLSATPTAPAAHRATQPPSASIGLGAASVLDPTTGAVTEVIPPGLDEATHRAMQLQDRIELAQQDAIALEQRVAVVNVRVLAQMNELEQARIEYQRTRARFEERIVEMYKSGLSNPFVLLLSSRSLADFYTRALLLSRMIADDSATFRDAEIASREAEFVSSVLDDMKAQLVELRGLYDTRLETAREALAEERTLIATLSAANRKLVAARHAATTLTRKQWRDSSIPIGASIRFIPALLDDTGGTYLVSDYQPLRYTSLGPPFSAVCSWYGDEFNGRGTASGQVFNEDDLTCASRTLPFGTRLALTRGTHRIIVVVTDRGPFIAGRDLDLSKAAARALGFSGVERVAAVYVRPSSEVTPTAR